MHTKQYVDFIFALYVYTHVRIMFSALTMLIICNAT